MPEKFAFERRREIEKKFSPNFRIGTPEESRGLLSYELLRRACDKNWGTKRHGQSIGRIDKFFEDEELEDVKEQLSKFLNFTNDEALEWIAAASIDASLHEAMKSQLLSHKGLSGEDAEKLIADFSLFLENFSKKYPSPLSQAEKLSGREMEDFDFERAKEYIDKAAKFFNPNPQTTKTKETIFLPLSPLASEEEGGGMDFGDKWMIRAGREQNGEINYRNIVHEFLHSVINPITKKINLTEEEKEKIIKLAPHILKSGPGYKDNAPILLNEVLIRTYGLEFGGEHEATFEDFIGQVNMWSEEKFQEIKERVSARGMTIKSEHLEDFKKKELKEFFEKYVNNELARRTAAFYNRYLEEKNKDKKSNFEHYFLENYRELIK